MCSKQRLGDNLEKMCLAADEKVLWHDRGLWGWDAALLMKKVLG